MKRIYSIIVLSLMISTVFAQGLRRGDNPVQKQKTSVGIDITPAPLETVILNEAKAPWDILFSFNASAAANPGIETDGTNFYTTTWNAGTFTRYNMDGSSPTTFSVTGVTGIRDMAYDGTYFYGSPSNMTIYIMDLANETLIGTIPVTCTGVTGVRHIAYDPNLDGGNGGFWIGNWNELGAIAMNGSQLVASTATLQSCYGSAYDPFTDPDNPCLWLFQQPTGAEAVFYQFDINTYSMTGVTHDCSDAPGFVAASISGGACSYEDNGKWVLVGSIQQDPNLVVAYELANVAELTAPNIVQDLIMTPGADGALTYSVSWTNPTTDVNGDALSEITEIYCYLNGVLVTGLTFDYTVGNSNSFADLTVPEPGYYTFRVVCENSAGIGLNQSVTEWIGYYPPENIAFSNIEDISIDLSWTQEGTPDSWDIELLEEGVSPTGIPTTNTTSNPHSLSSLSAGTSYDVYMRSVYSGGNSIWVGPYTFTTLNCLSADMCEYVFNLVDTWGDGWNGASIDVIENSTVIANITIASGASAVYNIGVCHDAAIELVWNAGSYDSEIQFVVNDPFGEEIFSTIDVTAFTNGGVFHSFTSNCTPPACPAPNDLMASDITTNSANLGWVEAGSATTWNIEIGTAGFSPTGSGVSTTTNPYNASSLTSGTAYDFYVQADCGSETSIWKGPYTFVTACSDITTIPYTEDFEAMNTGEEFICWSSWANTAADGGLDGANLTPVSAVSGDNTWFVLDPSGFSGGGADYIHGGTKAAAIGYTAPEFNWLVSTNITLPTTVCELKFWTWFSNDIAESWISKFYVQIFDGTSWNNALSWIDGSIDNELASQVVVDLSAYANTTIKIAFVYEYNDGFEMAIDDVNIDFASSIKEISKNISIYPNPSTGIIQVSNAKTIVIYNMIGEVVATVNNSSTLTSVDLSNLSDGAYIVKANNGTDVITKKINIIK